MKKLENTKTSFSYLIVTILTWLVAKTIEASDKYHIFDYERDVFIAKALFMFVLIFAVFTIINLIKNK